MRSFRQSRLIWCLVVLLGFGVVMLLGGCESDDDDEVQEHQHDQYEQPGSPIMRADVVRTNANIAFAGYSDSLATATVLLQAVKALADDPTEETLQAAKTAWIEEREAYQPTEVYRFRVGPIDALKDDGTIGEDGDGPEARINGWPLGEAFIDYVAEGAPDGDDGPDSSESLADAPDPNIIADSSVTITKESLKGFVEFGDDERNLATGYHAIEFLLWGQDLNAGETVWTDSRDNTPGHRPVSDYYPDDGCTSGPNPAASEICVRRATYLVAVTELLKDDLQALVDAWNPNGDANYYASFTDDANTDTSLAKILEGMGRLGAGELAGERINIALLTDSQEDEHSCFSDNTHRDILLNVVGIQNQYLGEYVGIDGDMVTGPGVYDLLTATNPEHAEDLRMAIEDSLIKAEVIDALAKAGMPFDQQIEDAQNPNIKGLITALAIDQTDLIEAAIQALGLTAGDLRQDTEEDIF